MEQSCFTKYVFCNCNYKNPTKGKTARIDMIVVCMQSCNKYVTRTALFDLDCHSKKVKLGLQNKKFNSGKCKRFKSLFNKDVKTFI